jgi:mannonate dehydratase
MAERAGMRLAIGQFNELSDEKLRFAVQLGVPGVQMNTPDLPGETHWEEADLRTLVERCAAFGLTMEAIENVPLHFYDKAMLGLPGGKEQIAAYQTTIRNVGAAGIPVLGYHWMPNSVWRTPHAAGRGGVRVTAFDLAVVGTGVDAQRAWTPQKWETASRNVFADDAAVDHETMWANYDRFMAAVLPVAEEAGVRLALHPDDPPVPSLGGVARLFGSVEGFARAHERWGDSPAWALDLCLGCCSEMTGGAANVFTMIERFAPLGKIAYIHFRDVQGTVPCFQECFLGEGNYDPANVLRALKRGSFAGFILDDHVPAMDDDTAWGHRARAHAIGYIQGMLKAIESEGRAAA